MPKFYSAGGKLVSQEEYNVYHGITKPKATNNVVKKVVKVEEVKKEEVKEVEVKEVEVVKLSKKFKQK